MENSGVRDSTLLICGRGEVPSDREDSAFVVEDELQQVDEDVYDTVYAVLSSAEPLDGSVPVYRTGWRHVVAPENVGLQESVVLYMRLEEVVSKKEPESLVCGEGIKRRHKLVVADVADEHGLEVEGVEGSYVSSLDMLWRFLKNTFLVLPFLLDQIFSLFWRYVSRNRREVEMAFIPSLGRLGSTLPVLEQLADSDYDDYLVVITSKVSSQARRWNWRYRRSELDKHNLVSLSSYTSFGCIRSQVSAYIKASKKVIFGDELKDGLDRLLSSEFDVHLDRTLDYTVYEAFRTRVFLSIFFYKLTDALVNKTGCEKIVIGGLSPSRRAIMLSGIRNNADVFYVPHNIGSGGTPNPPPELIHFVSGKLEERRYTESKQVQEPWNWVVTGRPYLVEMYEKHKRRDKSTDRGDDDGLRILVATQGFSCRHEFVECIVDGVNETGLEADIVIKTHPSEDTGVYSEYAQCNDITVTDSNLFRHIDESDLTVTINSNVGLESVIAGTPTVCVNMWRPTISDPIYSMYGPIPVLRSKDEAVRLLGEVDKGYLTELWSSEDDFVQKYFELETDSAGNITDVLVS